jgi:mono/diheme cytochrome c family protein
MAFFWSDAAAAQQAGRESLTETGWQVWQVPAGFLTASRNVLVVSATGSSTDGTLPAFDLNINDVGVATAVQSKSARTDHVFAVASSGAAIKVGVRFANASGTARVLKIHSITFRQDGTVPVPSPTVAPSPAPTGNIAGQLVIADATYTHGVNTPDSHYYAAISASTPANWTSPVNYGGGITHTHLEVKTKPSAEATQFQVCYELKSGGAACAYLSAAYTKTGVYDWDTPASGFWTSGTIDWSKGINRLAMILKDTANNKVTADVVGDARAALFVPTQLRVTVTIVKQGQAYAAPTNPTPTSTPAPTPTPTPSPTVDAAAAARLSAVRTILQAKCLTCHAHFNNYTTDAQWLAAVGNYDNTKRLVSAGNPSASPIFARLKGSAVTGANQNMPESGTALTTDQLNAVKNWVQNINGTAPMPSPTPTVKPSPAPSATPGTPVEATYASLYAKVFQPKCLGCHGGTPGAPSTNFTSYTSLMAGSAVKPGAPDQSSLYIMVNSGAMPKPPFALLTAQEISAVRAWIQSGASEGALACGATPAPGRVTMRRLNRAEYNNTLRDLLGITSRPADSLDEDPYGEFFNNNAEALILNPTVTEKLFNAAEAAVNEAFTLNKARFMTCSATTDQCARDILNPFVLRAYRRPPTTTEIDKLVAVVNVGRAQGETFEGGIKMAMRAALSSSSFLFRRIEHSAPNSPSTIVQINPYELAARLSYFLWSSMPDDTLLNLAKDGTIRQAAVIQAQVTRMLADAKSRSLADEFGVQMLMLQGLLNANPDTTKFPTFNATLKQDMMDESRAFMADLFASNAAPSALLKADYSFINSRLATHYGVKNFTGTTALKKTPMTGTGRQGILGHASVLTMNSHPTNPSIVRRGRWVLLNLLCDPPPPPPQAFEIPQGLSEVEQSALRQSNPTCMGCHQKMDPVGQSMHNFNGIGQLRTTDENGAPINTSGKLFTGEYFKDSVELTNLIQADARFEACITKKMLSFALGRDMREADKCTINAITSKVSPDAPVSNLIQAIILSEPFNKQSGE